MKIRYLPSARILAFAFSAAVCLAAAVFLSGCASAVAMGDASAPSVKRADAVFHPTMDVMNFGDSITCGEGAQPRDGVGNIDSNEGYAGLLDQKRGATARNLCHNADQTADMTRQWVYPNTNPTVDGNQLFTVMAGTNDANFCGISDACLSNWSAAYAASLVWLALPAGDKRLANQMVATGSWKPDAVFPQGMTTYAEGDRISYKVHQIVGGRMLNIAYRVVDSSVVAGGSASVELDYMPVATINTNPPIPIATHNGTTDTVYLLRIPMGAPGGHRVTLITNSPGQFTLLWVGVATQSYDQVPAAPHVMVNLMLPSPLSWFSDWLAVYSAHIQPLVDSLRADGLYITVADPSHALDVNTDFQDFLHPNGVGHAKLAAVDDAALSQP